MDQFQVACCLILCMITFFLGCQYGSNISKELLESYSKILLMKLRSNDKDDDKMLFEDEQKEWEKDTTDTEEADWWKSGKQNPYRDE